MSKKQSVDLDFDDIAGPVKKKTVKKKEKKKEEKETKLSGIILSIPVENNKFLTKDLVECSPEEFYEWASFVYPDTSQVKPEAFVTISARKRAFKQVLSYHLNLMTEDQKNTWH